MELRVGTSVLGPHGRRYRVARIEKYDPNQPRVPKGDPEGGRWTGAGGGGAEGDEEAADVAWHGTTDDAAKAILSEGLRVHHAGKNFAPELYEDDRGRSVFITQDRNRALYYANVAAAKMDRPATPVVIKLRVPEKEWDTFKRDMKDFTAVHRSADIPPDWIVKVSALNPAWEEDRVLYQKKDDGYVTVYAVILVEDPVEKAGPRFARFAETGVGLVLEVEKYDPDQPRKPKGDPEGGRWTDAAGSELYFEVGSDEAAALRRYTSSPWGKEINADLREGREPRDSAKDIVEGLDKALLRASLPEDTIVSRWVTADFYEKLRGQVGGEFEDRGFVSTTRSPYGADGFKFFVSKPQYWKVVDIHLPKGSKALDVAVYSDSYNAPAKEVLIARGARFRVQQSTGQRLRLELQSQVAKRSVPRRK